MAHLAKSVRSGFLLAVALGVVCGLGIFALGIRAPGAGAQSFTGQHAKIALVAEDGALKPGQTAWIGLFFDLEKGWHIYWENPGDSGEAPRVQWGLPKGFRAGDIRWPTPVRLATGNVIDYGYQGRVLLPLPLEVPADYKPGAPAMLSANVGYLICREVCIPAKATATLSIPPAKTATPDAAATRLLFQDARAHSPKPLPPGAKVQAADDGKNLVLTIETASPETTASFFPLEEDQVDNGAPQAVKSTGNRVQITLKKSDQLRKPIPVLKGVVVFSPDLSYEIAAPVAARH